MLSQRGRNGAATGPVALVYANGTVLERCEYDAYGNCSILEPNFAPDPDGKSDYENPYLFTGRRVDILNSGSLKIMYYRARYYDTETGRFLSRDPLGVDPDGGKSNPFAPRKQYVDGMNLYQYVSGNPTIYLDPKGRGKLAEIAKRVLGLQLCRLAGCLAAVAGIEIMCDIYLDDEDWARCTCEVMVDSLGLRVLCFGYRNKIMDASQCSVFGVEY